MANAGQLKNYVELLRYEGGEWKPLISIYAAHKRLDRVIYSRHAAAVEGAEFTTRRFGVTRHMAIRYAGTIHLVTTIDGIDRGYIKLTAAAVHPMRFHGVRSVTVVGRLNRPETFEEQIMPFCGVLNERYVRAAQEMPELNASTQLILTVPKDVQLKAGDLLKGNGSEYTVMTVHELDEYYNDYEIARKDEA